jgi:two-component system nitrate/nitrite response regulator NarL
VPLSCGGVAAVGGPAIRVLHCDRSRLFADVFAVALHRRGHEVTWVAHPDDLATTPVSGPVDVCLTEVDISHLSEVTVVRRLRERWPDARLVVLARDGQHPLANTLLRAGAAAVVPKTAPIEYALQAIEGARTGVVAKGSRPDARGDASAARMEAAALTPREHQVLAGLARGHATGDIAAQLGVAPTTARTYIQNILTKLGVHSKVQAVALAFALDLVSPGDGLGDGGPDRRGAVADRAAS